MFKKSLWFLSGFCTVLFFVPDFAYAWVILLITAALLLWLSLADSAGRRLGFSHRVMPNVLGLLFVCGCGLIFYFRWIGTLQMEVCLAATITLGILSTYFVLTTIAKIFMRSWAEFLPLPKKKHKVTLRSRLFIIICVVALIYMCSACSFLYPVNPAVSANTLMTGGRSMLSGVHLYEELYGPAGPVPYFFNALSWMLFKNFSGIFLLEIVLDCLFFIYLIKMVSLFFDGNKLMLAFPLMAMVFFASEAFSNGDTSEEFCLLFLCISFYISVRELRWNRLPDYSHFFIVGLCIGFVTWTQFNVLGFFAGWLLLQILMMIFKHRWKKLFLSLFFLLSGAAAASAPVVYYFYSVGTLETFLQSYFVEPLILNASNGGYVLNALRLLLDGILRGILYNPLLFLQTTLSLLCALRLGNRLFFQVMICFAGMVIGQYAFFACTPSSPLVWNVFGGFALILYYQLYQALELTYFRQFPIRIWGLLVCVIASYFISNTTVLADHKPTDFAQVQAAAIIDQVRDAKLLCYNMPDRGFYTYSGLLPVTKYYGGEYDEDSEYLQAQRKLITSKEVDFIITPERLSPELLLQGKYSLIKSMNSGMADKQSYYLYTKNIYLGDIVY